MNKKNITHVSIMNNSKKEGEIDKMFDTGSDSRKHQLRLELADELSKCPRDVDFDQKTRIISRGWTKCRDEDYLAAIHRENRDTASNMHKSLRRHTEEIHRIDLKGEENWTEADIKRRDHFIENIETMIGKGKGEEFLIFDPEKRWDMLLDSLQTNNIYPREKVGPDLYRTMNLDGHMLLGQKSIDRSHNQLFNQNMKNLENCVDMPRMNESQMKIRLGYNARHKEICYQSIRLKNIQDNMIYKRLAIASKNDNIKKLMSSDPDKDENKSFDFVDIEDMAKKDNIDNNL